MNGYLHSLSKNRSGAPGAVYSLVSQRSGTPADKNKNKNSLERKKLLYDIRLRTDVHVRNSV